MRSVRCLPFLKYLYWSGPFSSHWQLLVYMLGTSCYSACDEQAGAQGREEMHSSTGVLLMERDKGRNESE